MRSADTGLTPTSTNLAAVGTTLGSIVNPAAPAEVRSGDTCSRRSPAAAEKADRGPGG
jgi:hypothetical protein